MDIQSGLPSYSTFLYDSGVGVLHLDGNNLGSVISMVIWLIEKNFKSKHRIFSV